ncbi:MAG TPA: cell division protein FtsA [Bryobacteraceae bacterium]|jgi:cell division protein FtsA|nr:cell division protein FtsA [Bryobacteraceae bacterium]
MNTPHTFDAVGLDAGSAWTRCVICRLEDHRLRFLGCAEGPSQGWLKGLIADQNAVSECMLAVLREAERCAQVSVEGAVVGVGAAVRGANCRGMRDLGRTRTVEQRDVNRAMERARRVRLPEGAMILHLSPQDFIVDGHPGHRDPRKMIAGQIEANVHLVMSSQREHDCLVTAVNQAHWAVEETVFEALAASYAAMLPEDRREGAALLNIGAQSSELIVYHGDALQLAESLPISGDHFTRDVARGLCISFEDALTIKHEFGCAQPNATAENCFVELPSRDNREASLRTLNCILEARALELFRMVERELERVSMDGALMGGMFLCGGGAKLEGMCEIAEEVLKCGVAKALPVGIQDWPDEICDPAWTTTAGLAMYSAKLKSQREMQKQTYGLLSKVLN